MQQIDLGKNGRLTIKSIRDFIIDNGLSENDTVIINSLNFDDIILEYRQTYNESIVIPYYLLGVKVIEADNFNKVSLNQIKVILNDPNRSFEDYISINNRELKYSDLSFNDKVVYRCGWCGNVVDEDGSEFSDEIKNYKINVLEKFKNQIVQTKIHGKCCLYKNSK